MNRWTPGAARPRWQCNPNGAHAHESQVGQSVEIVVVASMFFGGVTGSAVAEVSSIGRMMIPGMIKDGYSRRFATATTLMMR